MTNFSDLFWSRRELWPADHQHYVEQQFPLVLGQSNLHLWHPGGAVTAEGRRYLVGVATWSEYDMRLLDLLDAALVLVQPGPVRVDVFSLQVCQSAADFESYIPDLGPVFQTPVIGVWQQGVLLDKGTGARAREKLLVAPFSLDWAGQRWQQEAGTR